MRCLVKLAVAVCVAVVAQVLVQPGGVGDEFAFAARVYVGDRFFGIPPESPVMVEAAARLIERQGHFPESLRKRRECAMPKPDGDEVADAAEQAPDAAAACTSQTALEELACAR
jgi:hypothetical protein